MTTRLQPAELPRWSRWLGGTPPPSPNTLHGTSALPRETHIPATADRYNSGRSKAATAGPEPSFLPGLGREPAPIAARTPSCGGGVNDAPGASREPRAGVSLASFLTSFNVDFDVSFPSKWGFAQGESQNAHAQLGYQLSPPIWGLSHQPRLPKLVPSSSSPSSIFVSVNRPDGAQTVALLDVESQIKSRQTQYCSFLHF